MRKILFQNFASTQCEGVIIFNIFIWEIEKVNSLRRKYEEPDMLFFNKPGKRIRRCPFFLVLQKKILA